MVSVLTAPKIKQETHKVIVQLPKENTRTFEGEEGNCKQQKNHNLQKT